MRSRSLLVRGTKELAMDEHRDEGTDFEKKGVSDFEKKGVTDEPDVEGHMLKGVSDESEDVDEKDKKGFKG
jgi:hypothetical protein